MVISEIQKRIFLADNLKYFQLAQITRVFGKKKFNELFRFKVL